MKKIYQAPEVEIISLTAQENVTDDIIDDDAVLGESVSIF